MMTTSKKTAPSAKPAPKNRYAKRHKPPAPKDAKAKELKARIKNVVFKTDDGQFAVVRGFDEHDRDVTLTGPLAHLHSGEQTRCVGEWKEHSQHGWSFQVTELVIEQPDTKHGIASFLESSVPGIGPVFARAIVETFGEDTLDIIDKDPKVLMKVKTPSGQKMSTKKIRAVIESWDEARAIRKLMVFLSSHGVTTGLATRIYNHYREKSLATVQDNPYRIVEIRGIGFKIADQIARNLNVPLTSPHRIRAGILYCLQQAEGLGHCFLFEQQVIEAALEQLVLDEDDQIREQLTGLIEEKLIVMESSEDGNRLYLKDIFFVERSLGKRVTGMLNSNPRTDLSSIPSRDEITKYLPFEPSDDQWRAVENATRNRISLITGLPGTGKTTLITMLLDVLDRELGGKHHTPYLLASPTGKAARRMSEATGRTASTLHRMLHWAPQMRGFAHNENNPLDAAVVIVDETSMVDVRLADALLRAIGPDTHLVLVGDADQLSPVGAGKVFDDLIATGRIPSVRLTEIFRQAKRSLIVRNAHNIVGGTAPFYNPKQAAEELGISPEDLDEDYFFVSRDDPEHVAAAVVDFAADRIPKKYGLDPLRDVLVLAPMKAGACGLTELNRRLQWRLNEKGEEIGTKGFRVGDRIIQTRNDYTLEIMNGEMGIITAYDGEAKAVSLELADKEVTVPLRDLDSFMLAYAISVHRSQGSQAKAVVCVVATSHYIMLTRSLVNTAITRAQQLCVCVGQPRAMHIAVDREDARERNTALAERIVLDSVA